MFKQREGNGDWGGWKREGGMEWKRESGWWMMVDDGDIRCVSDGNRVWLEG